MIFAHRVPPASWLWNGRGEEGARVCQRVGSDCIMSANSSTVKMVAQDRVKERTVSRWGARCWWGNLQPGWRGSSWHRQLQPQAEAEAALASPITKDGPQPKCKPCSQRAVPKHQVLISRRACGGAERVGKCPMPWGDSLSFCSITPSKAMRTALAKHSK